MFLENIMEDCPNNPRQITQITFQIIYIYMYSSFSLLNIEYYVNIIEYRVNEYLALVDTIQWIVVLSNYISCILLIYVFFLPCNFMPGSGS